MSSLIPERTIAFSPSLAATIGLEEAILLQVLNEVVSYRPPQPETNLPVNIQQQQLENLLPFWNDIDIQRIAKNLVDIGIILLDSAPYTQSRCLRFRFNEQPAVSAQAPAHVQPTHVQAADLQPAQQRPPPQHAYGQAHPAQPSPEQNRQNEQSFEDIRNRSFQGRVGGANRIASNWQPGPDIFLQLNQHSIDRDFALAQLPEFITYWRERGEVSYSWGAKFLKHVIREWRHHQNQTPFVDQAALKSSSMAKGWQPSPDAMEILTRTGIDAGFIEDTIPEFVLYWQERGDSTTTWNSKFIRHIKQQWARFTHTLKHDTEPKPISNDWQPDSDVFDIIRLANIDMAFAQAQVKEFVIYWRDSKQLHSSWNTKFLQHVKYRWANQHQLNAGNGNAGWKTGNQSGNAAASSFVTKHTDRSWADGL